MTNEKAFFDSIRGMERIVVSAPLTHDEIMQIYDDVSRNHKQGMQLFEFVRRIEHAHLIGISYD